MLECIVLTFNVSIMLCLVTISQVVLAPSMPCRRPWSPPGRSMWIRRIQCVHICNRLFRTVGRK